MKLLCCCMVAVLITTVSNAAIDVERTVKQVQTILRANAQLPRLTRDEIIQLLNDIKAEDAKSKSSSMELSKEKEGVKTAISYNINDNEVSSAEQPNNFDNIVADQNNVAVSAPASTEAPIESSTKSETSVTVVLPYTPRDGATLQELYTRPPRIAVVPESKIKESETYKLSSSEKIQQTLKSNAADKQKLDFPAELQAFLDSRGLKSKLGQDPFLLPLEGFKPLPPARVVDGSVQLPENILLAYDLISPSSEAMATAADIGAINSLSPTNFQNEPLQSEFPYELDTSPSDMKKSVLPLDMPKHRNTKSATVHKPNYEPIDYDSIRVIPLHRGPNPLEDEKVVLENDLGKRQINLTVQSQVSAASATADEGTTSTPASDSRDAITNAPSASDSDTSADTDTGASIADLEDSFGGAVPAQPGDSELPPPKKNGFYWMLDWNSFLEVGDGDTKVNIRFEPKLGDPQMFLPVNVP